MGGGDVTYSLCGSIIYIDKKHIDIAQSLCFHLLFVFYFIYLFYVLKYCAHECPCFKNGEVKCLVSLAGIIFDILIN